MDEASVRNAATEHASATVAGDLKTAGATVDPSAYQAAGEVMKAMPRTLEGAEIASVRSQGDGYVVEIRYSGEGRTVAVESTWSERDGGPKIVGLRVADA